MASNAHVILSGEAKIPVSSTSSPQGLFLLSATNQKALNMLQQSWATWIGDDSEIGKAAEISQRGRTAFRVRQSLWVESAEELKEKVKCIHKIDSVASDTLSVALMFTGQGSQYAGMSKYLYQSSTFFRDRLDEKLTILQQFSGYNYHTILFEQQEAIHEPQHTQPSLLALEVALAEYLQHCGVQADLMLGHSLGEYSAMVISKALSFSDAAKLILLRSQLLQETEPGAMCSVMAGIETLRPLLDGIALDIAALNSSSLSVVSGSVDEIKRFMARAEKNAVFCQQLKVKRAFHSRLLDPVLPVYREALQGVTFSKPQVPVISTLTGQKVDSALFSQPDYWVRQMREPVAFATAVSCAATHAEQLCFIEVGPGQTLKTLASQTTRHLCVNLLPHPGDTDKSEKILYTAFGHLWERGIDVKWQNLRDRVALTTCPPLPEYPFELTECWTVPKVRNESLSLQSYQQCWIPLAELEETTDNDDWLLITDGSTHSTEQATALCAILVQQGKTSRVVAYDSETCAATLKNAPANIALLLHPDTFSQQTSTPLLPLLTLVRNWEASEPCRLSIITRFAIDLLTTPCPALATLTSAVKSLNQEYPALTTRLIDSDGQDHALLIRELRADSPVVVALRQSARLGEGFILAPVREQMGNANAPRSVLILGGGGQVGLQYARTFLENSQTHVCLLQRSSLETLKLRGDKAARQRAARIEALMQRWPSRLMLYEADVESPTALLVACRKAKDEMGSLDTLIHAAGVDASMHYRLIKDIDVQFCHTSFAAKSRGLHNMAEIAKILKVQHCHVISSISSLLGGIGMYIYGSLHAWLDAAVAELCRKHPSRWTLLNWEAWEFGNDEEVPDQFRQGAFGSELNRYAMHPTQGRRFLWQCWNGLNGRRIISNIDFQQRYIEWVHNQFDTSVSVMEKQTQKAPRPEMGSEYHPAQSQTEEKILVIWESLLGLNGIGIDDNFFELGGHSLLALRMTSQVNQAIHAAVSMVDIFQYPTIRKLAASTTKESNFNTIRNEAALRAQKRHQMQRKRHT